MGTRIEKALEQFKGKCNCCQAVVIAYSDMYDIDQDTVMKIGASFGGGIGGMRETCGAASGMFLLAGYEHYKQEAKGANYKVVQRLAAEFTSRNGALKCREILELRRQNNVGDGNPSKITCSTTVGNAVAIYTDYLKGDI